MSSLNSATAPCSVLQMANRVPNGSSAWRRIVEVAARQRRRCRQSGRARAASSADSW
jgi:hypothetical protein